MDALAAYGSDDDESSSGSDAPARKDTSGVGALSGLIDYSDDDEEQEKPQKTVPVEETEEAESNQPSGPPPEVSRKRKRRWDNPPAAQEETASQLLPPPPLSNSSLTQWDVDYTAKYRAASSQENSKVSPQLVEKLNALYEKTKHTSWAHQLQAQHEFHNPHFFQNVVSHFGIQDALGSTAAFPENFQPFEYNVVAAEEQARIRHQQQQAAATEQQQAMPSDFAQQQLEAALRR